MNRVFNWKNIKFLIQNNLIKIKRIINNDWMNNLGEIDYKNKTKKNQVYTIDF